LTETALPAARASCPLCGSSSAQTGSKNGVPLRRCTSCGHRFAGVLPDDGALAAIYADDYFTREYGDYHAEAHSLAARGAAYRHIVERWRTGGRVLDVGAAAGYVLEGFTADANWTGAGIELNAAMAQAARSRGIDVRAGTVESVALDGAFDAVLLVQVIAHFPHPVETLTRLRERTAPGGVWVIETWDRESVVARALGRRWHEINPPSVLHWFSCRSLDALLASLGFERVARGRPRKTIGTEHVRALLGAHPLLGPLARVIPRGAEIPYPGDDVFWAAYRLRDDATAERSSDDATADA
jgi:SAM-dependent methyltransferase